MTCKFPIDSKKEVILKISVCHNYYIFLLSMLNFYKKGYCVDIFILTSIILVVTTLVVGKIFFELA